MNRELDHSRPEGRFAEGTEAMAVRAAERIVKEHQTPPLSRKEVLQRVIKAHKNNAVIAGGTIALSAALVVGGLFLAPRVPEGSSALTPDPAPAPVRPSQTIVEFGTPRTQPITPTPRTR